MEQENNSVFIVSEKPGKDERREIRKQYSRTALVLLTNIVIFNWLFIGLLKLCLMIYGGGFTAEAYKAGAEAFSSNELLSTVFNCLVPIISETTAILLGLKILKYKPDFRKLATREGYGGSTVMKLITLCLGLQLAASVLTQLIAFILEKFGLEGRTIDLSATTSFGANVFMYFYACLLGPVLEELLYRGILLQSMRKYNERFAIYLSALIFGLMHENYQQFVLAFLIGIPLAVVTIKHNSIIPAICTHIIVNTTASVSSILLQYYCPDLYDAALYGGEPDMSSIGTAGWVILIATLAIRLGFAIGALVVGIVSLVKGGNMSRPTPAGKSRALPVLLTSVPWLIVFALYGYLSFVKPFLANPVI